MECGKYGVVSWNYLKQQIARMKHTHANKHEECTYNEGKWGSSEDVSI